ncbi:MAG: hypothetical protein JWO22_4023 [Frankiales bacterium]|nr:hypothetical protein [Frankiales bacterium]
MSPEDRLRRLLQGMAGDQPATEDRWGALVARRRRRQAWQAGAVGAAGMTVVLAGVLALQGGGTSQTLVATDPTGTPTPTATQTATPAGAASPTAPPTRTSTPSSSDTPTVTATPVTVVPPSGPSAGPVRLGAVGAWSYPAPTSTLLRSSRTGVPQLLKNWAARLDADGGIAGRTVELTVLDSSGDAASLHQDMRQLVAQGVDAFVSTDVDAWTESYLRGRGIPVLGGDLSTTLWSTSPVLFAQGTDAVAFWDGLAVLAARQDPGGHLGVVCPDSDGCDTGPAPLIEDRRAAKYGLDPTVLERFPTSSTDYTAVVADMRSKGVTVVALAGLAPQQAVGLARTAQDMGFTPFWVLTSDLAGSSPVLQEPVLRGALSPQQVLPWPAAPAAFRAVLPDGTQPNAALTSAWAATQLAQEVVLSAGSSRGDLLAVANEQAGSTVGGVVPPLAPHHVQRCFYVGQVGTRGWRAPDGLRTSCGKP